MIPTPTLIALAPTEEDAERERRIAAQMDVMLHGPSISRRRIAAAAFTRAVLSRSPAMRDAIEQALKLTAADAPRRPVPDSLGVGV